MGNTKSSTSSLVDRKRAATKRGGKGKTEDGVTAWQPPGGARSYTSVDTELPGPGERKRERERKDKGGERARERFVSRPIMYLQQCKREWGSRGKLPCRKLR